MGKLTTHVLDVSSGKPAQGLRIELFALQPERRLLADVITNADGRVDHPLLQGAEFQLGEYELLFHAGEYLEASGVELPAIKFLSDIPLRFGISDNSHYHVPLLLSAYGYSTYRGS